jgi:hypothetical protein
MQFYLNQKSVPLIRRCINCVFFNEHNATCSKHIVASAYDHDKEILLKVSDNLYCPQHNFYKEDELKKEAVVIELNSIQEAMDIILSKKAEKNYNNQNY